MSEAIEWVLENQGDLRERRMGYKLEGARGLLVSEKACQG